MDNHLLGVYDAMVADTNDPHNEGRVRLYVPQVSGGSLTGWARPAGAGVVGAGDKVYMSYAGGDHNYPQFWPVTSQVQSVNGETGAALLVLNAGNNTSVTGAGTAASPWVVNAATSSLPAATAIGQTGGSLSTNVHLPINVTSIARQSATGQQWTLAFNALIAPVMGLYMAHITCDISGSGATSPIRTCGLNVNGSAVLSGGYWAPGAHNVWMHGLFRALPGDQIQPYGLANQTGDTIQSCSVHVFLVAPDFP